MMQSHISCETRSWRQSSKASHVILQNRTLTLTLTLSLNINRAPLSPRPGSRPAPVSRYNCSLWFSDTISPSYPFSKLIREEWQKEEEGRYIKFYSRLIDWIHTKVWTCKVSCWQRCFSIFPDTTQDQVYVVLSNINMYLNHCPSPPPISLTLLHNNVHPPSLSPSLLLWLLWSSIH